MTSLFEPDEPEVKIGAHSAGAVTWTQQMAHDADIGTVYLHANGDVGHLLIITTTNFTLDQDTSKALKDTPCAILISGVATAKAGGACIRGQQVFVIPATGLLTATSTGNKELVGARFITTVATGEVVQIAQ